MRYRDRVDAGRHLARALEASGYGTGSDPLVLGVARGGVPIAAEIVAGLGGQLDVAVARKIGAPMNPEFAIGAIAEQGDPLLDEAVIARHRIPAEYVARAVDDARAELERRTALYRDGRPAIAVAGRLVIVADDGVATGSTLKAVLRSVRARGAAAVVCAVPVGPPETVAALRAEADDVVCPLQPVTFMAVGGWYDEFGQLTDADVVAALGPH